MLKGTENCKIFFLMESYERERESIRKSIPKAHGMIEKRGKLESQYVSSCINIQSR